MGLYFWEPNDSWATNAFRKRYTPHGKLPIEWPSHIRVVGSIENEDLNSRTYGDAVIKVRRENLAWALGSATHLPYE